MAIPLDSVERDKRVLNSVSSLAGVAVKRALPDLSTLSQQDAGGVIRTVATGVISQFGEAATEAARLSYDNMTAAAIDALIVENSRRGIRAGAQILTARANAMRREAFMAKPVKVAKRIAGEVDPLVGQSMKQFSQGLYVESASALSVGVQRAVANIYRDTMISNSQADPRVSGFQRVASATACAFCMVVTLNQYTSFEESGGYHDHCSCSTVPIFKGSSPVRPEYYGAFEQEYRQGTVDAQSSKAEDILAAIRVSTGRK